MTLTIENARLMVANGVQFLNTFVPDWRSRVDTDRLSLMSGHACILAQVYRTSYGDARQRLGMSITEAVHKGFTLGIEDLDAEWEIEMNAWSALEAAWREELARVDA
jgi:hypothetical protein